MLTCKHCNKESDHLTFVQANIMQSPVDDAWVVGGFKSEVQR